MSKISKKHSSQQHKNKLGYIDPTVAGIDIGDSLIHVSIPDGKGGVIVKEFGSTTPQLLAIARELKEAGVLTAVMEATGVYWIPLYEILEDAGLKSVLVDARTVKNVPGRNKTDVVDCQWIQTLYSAGLLNAAFRPPRDRLPLRAYVRYRMNIVKSRQIALLHMEKALQLMNIKLSGALSDIGGISGMTIIRAIANGERSPIVLASLRNPGCKKEAQDFIDALSGNYQKEHVFVLQRALAAYDFGGKELEICDERILGELEGYPTVVDTPPPEREHKAKSSVRRKPKKNDLSFDARTILWQKSGVDMTALAGIEANTALLIFAELGGANVDAWNSEKEFASWLKLCPGNNISGGKRRKSKRQPCANHIAQALRMSALSAKPSKGAVGAHIRRICSRTDKPKGIKAGAHKLARLLYFMCRDGWQYHEKGEAHYEQMRIVRERKALIKKAKELGLKVVSI